MTGDDSPVSNKKNDFNYGSSTPPPTTSYAAKQDTGDVKTVAEPSKEDKEKEDDKDKDKNEDMNILRPNENPSNPNDNEIRRDECKKDMNVREYDDKDKPPKKLNGTDTLDGQWIPSQDSKVYADDDDDEEEGDNCTVKCLYYTMQCCECTIS